MGKTHQPNTNINSNSPTTSQQVSTPNNLKTKSTPKPKSLTLTTITTIGATLYSLAWLIYMIICSTHSEDIFGKLRYDCMMISCSSAQTENIGSILLFMWLAGFILLIPTFILNLIACMNLEHETASRRRRVGIICTCQAIIVIMMILCAFLNMKIFFIAYWIQTILMFILNLIMYLAIFLQTKRK